jgi:hypothetical protein
MLASLTELRSYRVEGTDGEIGRVSDLCFREDEWIVRYVVVDMEDESWTIPYLVVNVQSSGRRVLLASDYVQMIDGGARRVHVSVPRDAIVHSPVIASEEPITAELPQSLREYYDQYSR